ncbi:hypothetical protein NBRC13296_12020 [Paenibacillus chitinolyticus]|uniref:hypothetical protein n=1 Tax=Paenibacillus chitinolyticus TaxID=79263 RepID=UPI0035568B43
MLNLNYPKRATDLTGEWIANNGKQYIMRQFQLPRIGPSFCWAGFDGPTGANINIGAVRYSQANPEIKIITTSWVDIPYTSGGGTLGRLGLRSNDTQTKLFKESGNDIPATEWSKFQSTRLPIPMSGTSEFEQTRGVNYSVWNGNDGGTYYMTWGTNEGPWSEFNLVTAGLGMFQNGKPMSVLYTNRAPSSPFVCQGYWIQVGSPFTPDMGLGRVKFHWNGRDKMTRNGFEGSGNPPTELTLKGNR